MKILKVIKSLVIALAVIIYLGFAISMTLLAMNFNKYGNAVIGEYTFLFIEENVANEKYKENDLVVTKAVKNNKFNKGDEAFLYKIKEDEVTGSKSVSIMIGEVEEIDSKKEGILLKNEEFYSREFVIGKSYKVVPNLGGLLSMILNKTGFLIAIIVPIFFIFTAQIYALIVEIKFGDGVDLENETKEIKKIKEKEPMASLDKEEKEEEKKPNIFKEEIVKEDIKPKNEDEKPKKEKKEKVSKPAKKSEKTIDELADDFLND